MKRRSSRRRGRCRSISLRLRNPATHWARHWRARSSSGEAGAVKLSGVGGHAMAAAGIVSPFAIDELSIIGLTAIPQRLPKIFRRIRETALAVVAARPDALVIVDSPDFTHRVARRVRRLAPSIPIVDYVSPSVWAWRPGRARAMRAYVDQVLAILPFEPAIHIGSAVRPAPMSVIRSSSGSANCAPMPTRRAAAWPIRRLFWHCRAAGRARSGVSPAFSAPRSSVSPRASGRSISSSRPFRNVAAQLREAVAGWTVTAAYRGRAGARSGLPFATPARRSRHRAR